MVDSGGGIGGDGTEDVTVPNIVRSFGEGESPSAAREGGKEAAAIITARGTAEGLVLKIESNVSRDSLRRGLWDFMNSRRNFIAGNELILEWGGEPPDDPFIASLKGELEAEFEVTFKEPRAEVKPQPPVKQKSPSLFDGIEALGISAAGDSAPKERARQPRAQSSGVWDDADARIIYGTLRSGQKVETEHSVVVVGDVNSGAEVVAGGDVIVLGCLRGIAHAGAYDETGGGRTIFALNLQPTQVRIGGVISRGGTSEGYAGPEVARVDGSLIVVEAYQSRGGAARK